MENRKSAAYGLAFAAVDKRLETDIPSPVERESGRMVSWGDGNSYPQYLWELYNAVSTLKTVVNGIADYACGDGVECTVPGFGERVNGKGDTMRDVLWLLVRDWLLYGGFALQVIRDRTGRVAEIYYMDFRYARTSKKNEIIWYSEDFGRRYVRSARRVQYPAFHPLGKEGNSVLYVKNEKSQTYPVPRYSGSIRACEIEREIDTYHLCSLQNGFAGSYIINFYNGIPSDDEKDEIERNVNEKFAGSRNAGSILLNFASGKDNGAELSKLDVDDFGDRYKAAADRAKGQIFSAFRAIPQLFGDMSAATGFSSQEFEEAFRVFNRTVVMPVQKTVTDAVDRVFGSEESVRITPFSLGNAAVVE